MNPVHTTTERDTIRANATFLAEILYGREVVVVDTPNHLFLAYEWRRDGENVVQWSRWYNTGPDTWEHCVGYVVYTGGTTLHATRPRIEGRLDLDRTPEGPISGT